MKLVELSQGAFAIVDDADFAAVMAAGKWSAQKCGNTLYARRQIVDYSAGMPPLRRTIGMHTFLTSWPLVDHINGMTLDNRRENLRPATRAENTRNRRGDVGARSAYKGVFWHAKSRTWAARITHESRTYSLRYHHTEEEAARAYDRAALKFHGQFARTNFPREDYAA